MDGPRSLNHAKGSPVSRNVRYALIIFVTINVWLLSGLLVSDNETEDKAAEPKLTLVGAQVSAAAYHRPALSFNARTEPFRLVSLSAETQGPLVAADIAEGSEVDKGAVVGRIDVEGREFRLSEARSLLEQAQLEYQGALNLQDKGLLSDAEIARNKAVADSAKAAAKLAELELARVEMTAPFDGVLNERFYEVGDYLQKGQVFAEFLQLHPLKAVFQVSESEVIALDPSEPLLLELADGRQLEGKLLFRSAMADKNSRAFKVEAVFDNPGNQVLADLTGRISVSLKPVKAHTIPASVLSLDTQGRLSIKTVDANQIVVAYPVEVISDRRDSVWVTGLPDTVDVIVTGYEYVGVGEKVKVFYRDQRRMDALSAAGLSAGPAGD